MTVHSAVAPSQLSDLCGVLAERIRDADPPDCKSPFCTYWTGRMLHWLARLSLARQGNEQPRDPRPRWTHRRPLVHGHIGVHVRGVPQFHRSKCLEGRRCVVGSADALIAVGFAGQIARMSSVNAAATREAGEASTASL